MADDTAYTDQYNGGSLVVTAVLFLVLTWLSVALRTYVRAFMTKAFELDDWLMLAAQANFTVSCGFILAGVTITKALGRHNSTLPQWKQIAGAKTQAVATATYITNMMFIKLSIGFFLLRLATQRRFKWIIWVSMAIVLLWSTALFFWDVFQCQPVAAQWDTTIPNYTCVSATQVVNAAYALSVLNIVTDWLYALLPIPMIWKAKMTVQTKITVALILGLGVFASVATLIRVKFLANLTDVDDILYAGTDAMVWTLVEPGVAIVASSLVTIRPLLRQMRLRGFESSERSRSRSRSIFRRYGRNRGISEIPEGDFDAKRDRTAAAAVATEAGFAMPGDLKLHDLEGGAGSRRMKNTMAAKGISSLDTTLSSRTSNHDRDLGQSPAANSTVQHWDIGVAVTVHEGKEIDDDDDNDGEDDEYAISPVSPGPRIRPRPAVQTDSSSESVLIIEGPARAAHPGRANWRSEAPITPEESNVSQGLSYPARGGGHGRGPLP